MAAYRRELESQDLVNKEEGTTSPNAKVLHKSFSPTLFSNLFTRIDSAAMARLETLNHVHKPNVYFWHSKE